MALPVSPARDHIRGPVDAPVTLVEYGDFQCPYCAAAHPVVEAVRAEMGEEMRLVFRHFPLRTVHPRAEIAAEAAEAAGAQGRFWPMHDLLFDDNIHLGPNDLVARAEALELQIERFEAELSAHVHAERVHDDFLSGVYSGVQGTPTFFINGWRHQGPFDYQTLLAAARSALTRVG